MQRIHTLLQKLTELSAQDKKHEILDIDLMLDYTRVMYADLLELRKNVLLESITTQPATPVPPKATVTERVVEAIVEEPKPIPAVAQVAVESVPVTATIEEPKEMIPPAIKYEEVPTIDIRTRIGINDKYLYISELFNNDKAVYDEAIKQINNFTTLREANKWVDAELKSKYQWDAESETTQSFYSLLSSSFPVI